MMKGHFLKEKEKQRIRKEAPASWAGLGRQDQPLFSSLSQPSPQRPLGRGHLGQAQLLWRKNKKRKRAAPWLGFEPTTWLSSPRPATTALLLLD